MKTIQFLELQHTLQFYVDFRTAQFV